jgi:AbrB family looped-hinge helix DNA binding protein
LESKKFRQKGGLHMIVELRKKSQITLPKEIVKQLNLLEGDKFDITVEGGYIKLEPVVVYSKQYVAKLTNEIQLLRDEVNPECRYETVDSLLKSLNEQE